MTFPEVEWLLDCQPREVQLEALRRSYYGYALHAALPAPPPTHGAGQGAACADSPATTPAPRWLRRPGAPARGWGHLLEMRLGKTPLALNEFLLMRMYNGIRKGVVYSPNSYKADWAEEAVKFGLDIEVIPWETAYGDGIAARLLEAMAKGREDFLLIVNYEGLQYDKLSGLLKKVIDDKTVVFADESIKLKNHKSIQSLAARDSASGAKYTRWLTGLPMTQGPHDLYAQFRFGRQLDGTNFYVFRNRYAKMGGFKAKKVVGIKEGMEEKLSNFIASCAFVAKRKDWGKPTVPEFYTIGLELAPAQKKHYDEMDRDMITLLESGEVVTVDQVISKMLKLQQISSGFLYLPDGSSVELMPLDKTPKMKKLLEMMEDEIPGKVVVPYHYGFSGDALLKALKQYEPAVIRSKGWMKKNGRDAVDEKRRFNQTKNCRVMVLQISAGKYGHDLSGRQGDRTETMWFYENTYSFDDRQQVEMRITAAVQDWNNVYFDCAASKVERQAISALVHKESLVTAILGAYRDASRQEY